MAQTRVVHCKEEPYDIDLGRGRCPRTGKIHNLGNPFSHLDGTLAQFRVATRQESIDEFGKWAPTQPHIVAMLEEMRGKTLGCWCKKRSRPLPCHGDVYVEMIEARWGRG